MLFQHTATRRWLPFTNNDRGRWFEVSTHSHPKVAAKFFLKDTLKDHVSTHSHPKVAAVVVSVTITTHRVSTHSHPKVAAYWFTYTVTVMPCFNTQPPEGGCLRACA